MKTIKSITLGALVAAMGSLIICPSPALAGWGLEDLDPTNPDSDLWGDEGVIDQVIPDFPSGEEGYACTQAIVRPTYAEFDIINSTPWDVAFSVNDTEYYLNSGETTQLRVQRSSGSSDGCGGNMTYYPINFRWDGNPYEYGWQLSEHNVTGRADIYYEFQVGQSGTIYLY